MSAGHCSGGSSSRVRLHSEAENWFLRELRGWYGMVLKFVARHPGQSHGDLVEAIQHVSGEDIKQIGGYLSVLINRYRLIERRLPVFAEEKERKSRYYLADNFLQSWLAALSQPISALGFRPVDGLVVDADERLATLEGFALEKMVAEHYQERSRKGLGDFPLTSQIKGYWDKNDTEIDLVAVNENDRVLRFGSCKRSPSKRLSDVNNFKAHVSRFLGTFRQYAAWRVEYVGIAPRLDEEARAELIRHDVQPQDLTDLTAGLS